MSAVDPGPLGGTAKCGDTEVRTIKAGVCLWADEGSLAAFLMFNATRKEAEKAFIGIRGQVEQIL